MSEQDRDRIYSGISFIDDDERLAIALEAGMRTARYGEMSTHAICRHGEIAAAETSHHSCAWMPLVAIRKENDE